jgi:hypothetical protein
MSLQSATGLSWFYPPERRVGFVSRKPRAHFFQLYHAAASRQRDEHFRRFSIQHAVFKTDILRQKGDAFLFTCLGLLISKFELLIKLTCGIKKSCLSCS